MNSENFFSNGGIPDFIDEFFNTDSEYQGNIPSNEILSPEPFTW